MGECGQTERFERLRRLVGFRGLALRRSRVRDRRRRGFGEYYLTMAGSTLRVAGGAEYPGGLSLDDVEDRLTR